jgi:hypothetical protein
LNQLHNIAKVAFESVDRPAAQGMELERDEVPQRGNAHRDLGQDCLARIIRKFSECRFVHDHQIHGRQCPPNRMIHLEVPLNLVLA